MDTDIEYLRKNHKLGFSVNPEYGSWMAEIVPKRPLDTFTHGGQMLNMFRSYLKELYTNSREGSEFLSLPFMPKLGTKLMLDDLGVGDLEPEKLNKRNYLSNSSYMDDAIISDHPRFGAFEKCIRQRRGENPQIIVPLYNDSNTDFQKVSVYEPYAGKIHLDATTFGLGLSCLQVTFAAKNMSEGRWANDQFHIFTPLLVSLTNFNH